MGDIYYELDVATPNVWGIIGHLGGGKTLTAVEIALGYLRSGHHVITNIQLFNLPSAWTSRYSHLVDLDVVDWMSLPQGDPRGSGGPKRVCVIIDEVAEWFDQWSSASPQLHVFMSWLRHTSKRGQSVFLIVQNKEYLAKSLRVLIWRWVYVLDLYQLRIPIFHIRPPFLGGFVARRIYDRMGNKLSAGWLLCDKRVVGQYYNTAQSLSRHTTTYINATPKTALAHRRFFWLLLLYYIYWLNTTW